MLSSKGHKFKIWLHEPSLKIIHGHKPPYEEKESQNSLQQHEPASSQCLLEKVCATLKSMDIDLATIVLSFFFRRLFEVQFRRRPLKY